MPISQMSNLRLRDVSYTADIKLIGCKKKKNEGIDRFIPSPGQSTGHITKANICWMNE